MDFRPFAVPICFTCIQVLHACLSEDELNTYVIWSCGFAIFVNIMDDLVYYLVTTYRFSWVRYVDHCIFFIKIVIILIISYFNFIWAYFGTICMETFDCWTCHCYETLHLCPFAIPIGFTSVQVFHTCLSEDKLNTHMIWSCSITIFVNIVN
ncbi:Hypothetical cytosolic protein [Lactobacillus helveticus H10]|nr:Hypothetical cytosolic protein [Lactobacillus helveticus H10]